MAKVTVVTATVGNPKLNECVLSVARQTHLDVDHLVVVDGPERYSKALWQLDIALDTDTTNVERTLRVLKMPYSIGSGGWNGHRIYAAGSFMADGDYIMFLDDDNTLEPNHIESLLKVCENNDWAFSLRNIVDKDNNFLCQDNCESLGKWASVLHPQDFFVDVNCYFLPTKLAIQLGPAWYRKFRQPGQPEVDRVLAHVLMNNKLKYDCSYKYTVNYTVGNTPNSVQKEFFEVGNIKMAERYPEGFPWQNNKEG
jgi:glycosyltransferase involved in cell wall biosynthesis